MLKASIDILQKIKKDGGEAWIVGGAVRDIIIGKSPKDIDIATSHPMDKLAKIFKVYNIGASKDFGIVTVNHKGFQYEIAQLRSDGTYIDGRKPETVSFNVDLSGDMARRDLTINAMAIDMDGNIIDKFGGKQAIKNKVIQTVGNPHDRFGEDYIRMMRAIRFGGKLGFEIEPKTKAAIKKHASKLKDLSAERIKDELWKMASQSGDKFANTIEMLDDTGVLKIILPELMKLKDFKEMEEYHPEAYIDGKGTPFDHTLKALRKNKLEDPLTNMAILFHDIGKGTSYQNIDGKHTFHGHAKDAKELIDTIAKRLKLPNKERDALLFAAVNHMKLHRGAEMKVSKIIKLVKDENWNLLKAVSYCDDRCRIGLFDKAKFNGVINDMEKVAKKWGDKTVGTVVKVTDGTRVMKLTGLKPSKMIGDIIKKVTEIAISKNIKSDKELDKLVLQVYGEMK